MNEVELTSLIKNNNIVLSIPVYKCFLALMVILEKIEKSEDVHTHVFYGVEASYLMESIINAVPETKTYFLESTRPAIVAIRDRKNELYPIINSN